jgi:hypothetical protein
MPALLIDLQANWREYAETFALAFLLGLFAWGGIAALAWAGALT